MSKKKHIEIPAEIPLPGKHPEVKPTLDPEEPLITPPQEMPYIAPNDDPFKMPPYEMPPFGEGF